MTLTHITENSNFVKTIKQQKKKVKIPGLSFSIKRAIGISGFKNKVARKIGIPTTKQGLERKIGGTILKAIFGKKK